MPDGTDGSRPVPNAWSFDTELVHVGDRRCHERGATMPAIFQVNAFAHESAENIEAVFAMKAPGFAYSRVSNPTVAVLERALNKLEGGMGAIAYSSGMAALCACFITLAQAGDEIIASADLYGGTVELFEILCRLGIHVRFAPESTPEAFSALMNEHTKVLFCESISNPRLDVADISALADLAHAHGIVLVVDNTVATPCLVRPIMLGADIVVHSTSKYINANSTALGGVVVCSGLHSWNFDTYPQLAPFSRFGKLADLACLKNEVSQALGGCMSAQNAFLTLAGLETLGLRMRRICDNALSLARFFYAQAQTYKISVAYPGLSSHPCHELATRQFGGHYGGLVTLRVGSKKRAFALIDALKLSIIASNIGDTRTLVVHPATTIAAHLDKDMQKNSGVYDDQVRVSCGIEDGADIEKDFASALEKI